MSVGYLSQKKNFIQKVNEDKINVLSFTTGNDYDGKLIQDNYGRVYRYNATTGRYESKELEVAETASVMTKAEFEALAETRKKQYAGSGFVEWSGYDSSESWTHNITNNGLKVWKINNDPNSAKNLVIPGRRGGNSGETFNINGNIIELNNINSNGDMNTVNLPQSPLAFNVTDSTTLPQAMKQGDFAVLADLDREFIKNGTFDENIDGWGSYGDGTASYDSSNNRLKVTAKNSYEGAFSNYYYQLIKDVEYILSFDLDIGTASIVRGVIYGNNNSFTTPNYTESGTYELRFKPNGKTFSIYFENMKDESDNIEFYIDNVSLKQVEETPIVALQDVDANIDIYANASNFEGRDSVSAHHLAFLEVWEESITDKDFAYPFGNTQYRGGDIDGLTGITEGTFEGADTYSLFSDSWQQHGDLVGKGYVWSNLSDTDKVKLASNPDNNIYKDGDNWVQVRYRVRVEKTTGNINADDYMAKNLGYTYEGLGLWQS